MDSIAHIFWYHDKFLGVEWSAWKLIGWLANIVFSSRFIVQWYATEKKKQVVVPQAFWWLSLIGALMFLCYSIHLRDSVLIFAYAFSWIPYIRNVIIHRKHKAALSLCAGCGQKNPPQANFCPNCGGKIS
jgi:lipid-A-disaccharide synthase-like uncharacterized protein